MNKPNNTLVATSLIAIAAPTLANPSSKHCCINLLQANSLPNIVFVLADDMGIGDLNCYYTQDKIKTPNLDSLASHSLQFTHHYSGSTVSAPSRCCLMTGKHTGEGYIRGNKGVFDANGEKFDLNLPAEETTIAELLKDKGYATMCVGKWGLGGPGTSGSPINKGFDYFFGYLSQSAAHDYYPEYLYENETKYYLDGQYSHFVILEKGIDFIKKQPKEQPFFAYFSITPPHSELEYPDISQYEGKFDEPNTKNPRANYAAMVSEVDQNVGRIVALLKEKGVWDNTILIFSSDNGVHNVGGHDPDYFDCNGPFRGIKRALYEGGIRTPFILSWPEKIRAHRETDHISAFWDFLPTICDITNIDTPENCNGISYLPTILGKENKQEKHQFIYHEFYEQGGKQSIQKDGWKLVRLNMSKPAKLKEELYYLPNDIDESEDLMVSHPEKADELRRLAEDTHTESDVFKWLK